MQLSIIKKAALTKQNKPSGHKYFLQNKEKKKRRAKYVSDTKEKKKKEERKYIQRLNDLSEPMPKRFWYGRKRLY